jgi:predicted amidohydrolase
MAAVLLAMATTIANSAAAAALVMAQQHEAPPPVCEYPGLLTPALNASSMAEPVIMSATCSVSASLVPGASEAPSQLTVAQSAVARLADPQLYTDTREMVFDMSPRSSFVGAGRVKVASVQNPRVITEGGNKTGNIGIIIAALRAAKDDGALIATLTEEVFEYEPGQEQPIDGPGPTAVRQAAKDIGIAVVCPMRLLAADGRQYNAAIVIHANGSLAKAAYTGSEVTQKQFPVFGWPVGPGPRIQNPENPVVPGQLGTSVFDMPGIGRIAIVMCFDVNFPEAWYSAYALGAQIVFWPAEMGAPDRDVISYARLFRFHVVACGHSDAGTPVGSAAGIKESGMILDTTGETVADIKPLSAVSPCGGGQNCPNVVTGTLDLDAEWVHENGPGTNCQVLQKICKTYPGVFEFIIAGCGGETQGKGGLSGCTTRAQTDWWQRGTAPSNSVMLFASRDPDKKTVRAAFDEVTVGSKVKVVPWRDYIFANRQGINSLRQYGLPILPFGNMSNHPQRNTGVSDTVVGATSACQFPGVSMGPAAAFNHTTGTLENAERSTFEAALRPNFTCSPGLGSTAAVQLAVDSAATAPPQIYRNVHEFTYDMSKRTSFAGAARVKVASLPGAGGPINMNIVISQLKEAKADGALIATLTEESFGYSENDPGQPIDGPGPTAVRQAAKDIGIAVVCPMRLLAADGRQYNAAIVIHANGSLAKAAYTGSEVTQKQFPVYGYPLTAPGMAGRQAGGETNVVPGQLGTSVFDMPGIGRIAIVMCFDVNFPEAWYNAYALGAQIVFWPTVMGAPDRDVISYARLFRFHVVACGSRRLDSGHMDIKESGMILDTTGETVADIKALPSKVVTGTVDLDAEWLHSNGPGLITEPSLTRICAAYPGIFEFIINGEQGPPNHHPGCSARTYNSTDPWQRGTAPDNNLVLLASKFPEIKTVKEAAEEEGFVPWRDYIFAARKGINSLRLFGLPGLVWGGVEKGPLPAPPLPPQVLKSLIYCRE